MNLIALSRKINLIAVLCLGGILGGGFAVQILFGEKPCPLCLLQRMGMMGIMATGLMNLRFGIRPFHYGLALLSALCGASVSVRQILLHIAPGSKTYGTPILGLSLYSWAFIVFATSILGVSFLLMLYREGDSPRSFQRMSALEKFAFGVSFVVILGNLGWSLAHCGLGFCI